MSQRIFSLMLGMAFLLPGLAQAQDKPKKDRPAIKKGQPAVKKAPTAASSKKKGLVVRVEVNFKEIERRLVERLTRAGVPRKAIEKRLATLRARADRIRKLLDSGAIEREVRKFLGRLDRKGLERRFEGGLGRLRKALRKGLSGLRKRARSGLARLEKRVTRARSRLRKVGDKIGVEVQTVRKLVDKLRKQGKAPQEIVQVVGAHLFFRAQQEFAKVQRRLVELERKRLQKAGLGATEIEKRLDSLQSNPLRYLLDNLRGLARRGLKRVGGKRVI